MLYKQKLKLIILNNLKIIRDFLNKNISYNKHYQYFCLGIIGTFNTNNEYKLLREMAHNIINFIKLEKKY